MSLKGRNYSEIRDAALRELGQEHVTRRRREHLKRTLPANEGRELLKAALDLASSFAG